MASILVEKERETKFKHSADQKVRHTFTVNIENGLHARPCALLVKTLMPFVSAVEVEANGEQASGHSIMSLMALAAGLDTDITFTITGPDAYHALAAVRRLFETHFADAYSTPKYSPKTSALYARDH
jgi:phosphotransferase system HPr (HPr) family protein